MKAVPLRQSGQGALLVNVSSAAARLGSPGEYATGSFIDVSGGK